MRDRPPPPPSLSIDLRAEEKFRNASLNRDAMQKKKEERKEKKKKLGHRFGLSFQPLLFNLTLSSLESVPLKDESRGDEDLGRRDRRGSLGWSPNRRHIFLSAFALHPPPPHSIILHPFVSTGSVSLLENLFIGRRALEGVHGTRTPSTTLLPLLNSGAAVDGPRGDRRGHRNFVAVPSFTSETEAWLDRIQPFRSRSFRRPDAGNACKRMDRDPGMGGRAEWWWVSLLQVLREIRLRPEAKTRWSRASVRDLVPHPLL